MDTKIDQIYLPLRQNRQELDEEFIEIYTKLISVLKSDRQKKKSHRDAESNRYTRKEINHLSQRVIATADLLQNVAEQEQQVARSITSEIAKASCDLKRQKKQMTEEKGACMEKIEQLDYKRSRLQAQSTKVQGQLKDMQTQINLSHQNENTFATMLVESHTELNTLQHALQDYAEQMEAKKRAEEECTMYQSRLQQLHQAHESYVKEKQQYLYQTEKQLLDSRRNIQQIRQDMDQQNQMVHAVNCSIDQLIQQASYLDIQSQSQPLYPAALPQRASHPVLKRVEKNPPPVVKPQRRLRDRSKRWK